jgi:hypothetical protein
MSLFYLRLIYLRLGLQLGEGQLIEAGRAGLASPCAMHHQPRLPR